MDSGADLSTKNWQIKRRDPERIRALLEEGICRYGSVTGLARALGTSRVTVQKWTSGIHKPSTLYILKMERLFKE